MDAMELLSEEQIIKLVATAYRIAYKFKGRYDPESASTAHWALLKAIDTYNPAAGSLEAWVYVHVDTALRQVRRRLKRLVFRKDRFWLLLEAPAVRSDIDTILRQLDSFDYQLASDYWVSGFTQNQLRIKYNSTVPRIRKRLHSIRLAIKGMLMAGARDESASERGSEDSSESLVY